MQNAFPKSQIELFTDKELMVIFRKTAKKLGEAQDFWHFGLENLT